MASCGQPPSQPFPGERSFELLLPAEKEGRQAKQHSYATTYKIFGKGFGAQRRRRMEKTGMGQVEGLSQACFRDKLPRDCWESYNSLRQPGHDPTLTLPCGDLTPAWGRRSSIPFLSW